MEEACEGFGAGRGWVRGAWTGTEWKAVFAELSRSFAGRRRGWQSEVGGPQGGGAAVGAGVAAMDGAGRRRCRGQLGLRVGGIGG